MKKWGVFQAEDQIELMQLYWKIKKHNIMGRIFAPLSCQDPSLPLINLLYTH